MCCRTLAKTYQARRGAEAEVQQARAEHHAHTTKLNSEISRLRQMNRELEVGLASRDETIRTNNASLNRLEAVAGQGDGMVAHQAQELVRIKEANRVQVSN